MFNMSNMRKSMVSDLPLNPSIFRGRKKDFTISQSHNPVDGDGNDFNHHTVGRPEVIHFNGQFSQSWDNQYTDAHPSRGKKSDTQNSEKTEVTKTSAKSFES